MDLDTRGGVFSIDTILHILRAEGFYASEAALQRELEDRFSHQDLDRNGRRESEDPGNEAVKSQEPRIEDKTDNQERGESESRVTHDSAKSRSEAADEKPYDESRLSQDDMQPREDDIRCLLLPFLHPSSFPVLCQCTSLMLLEVWLQLYIKSHHSLHWLEWRGGERKWMWFSPSGQGRICIRSICSQTLPCVTEKSNQHNKYVHQICIGKLKDALA